MWNKSLLYPCFVLRLRLKLELMKVLRDSGFSGRAAWHWMLGWFGYSFDYTFCTFFWELGMLRCRVCWDDCSLKPWMLKNSSWSLTQITCLYYLLVKLVWLIKMENLLLERFRSQILCSLINLLRDTQVLISDDKYLSVVLAGPLYTTSFNTEG